MLQIAMKTGKIKLFSIVGILLTSVLLSACSVPFLSKPQGPVTLEYWGLWESPNTIDTIINDYKKINPNVNISYKKRTPQQYRESLENQIAQGSGPDIFTFHNTWVPMLKEELDPMPASVMSKTDYKNSFYPIAMQDLTIENEIVGFPQGYDGLGLFYNEDIFKAAGITKPPVSWTEFTQDAAKLTVKDESGNIRTAGAALGAASNVDNFSDILGLMILQNGGNPKNPKDKQSADALDYFTSFTKGQNRVWDETMPASTLAFSGGSVAMYFGPSWRAIDIKNANPLLKFKVAPLPQLAGAKVTWATYWANGISANSTHKKEAWDFAKYMATDEVLIKLYAESVKSPGRFFGNPYPKVNLASKLASDPIIGAFVQDAPFAGSAPMASRTLDNGLNDQIIKAYEDATNEVLAQSNATGALETASASIAQILAEFGAK